MQNPYPCSLLEGYNNGYYTINSTTISGFNSFTEGSILYVDALKIGRSLISGITITNCSTTISFFSFGASISNTLNLLTLINIKGRVFRITQKSTLVLTSLTITNNSCMISGLFQSGCIFYLDSQSSLTISGANITNVSNVETPGAFYIENSNLTIVNLNIVNTSSILGYGCLYSINSYAVIINSSFSFFQNGCFQIEKSSFTISRSKFINSNISNFAGVYGSTIDCTRCLRLTIDKCVFLGNKNNALDGSVCFFLNFIDLSIVFDLLLILLY